MSINKIPKDMLKDWIVEDLQKVFNNFDENRYSIFEDMETLKIIADNILSLKKWWYDD